MSKSLGNAINLSDNKKTVQRKVSMMFTDPTRLHPTDPGHTEGNPLFVYHDAFNPNMAEVEDLKARYRRGKVEDVEVKNRLAHVLNEFLDPIREKRAELCKQSGLIEDILQEGTKKARSEAQITLSLAKKAIGLETF
jgi:tryptophanyl-tRNA synthetase